MKFQSVRSFAIMGALALASACGDGNNGGGGGGGGGGGTITDRGGPDSLENFAWSMGEPIEINGIELQMSFRFDDDSVTVTSTCDGEVTVSTTAPVRYHYSASIASGDENEVEDGGDTCAVSIAAGSFDFEIVDGKLVATAGGESIEFSPVGSVAGLYGKWQREAPGVGTLIWSMGGGKIRATSECDNGVSATVEVPAVFTNRLQIVSASENTVEENGLECSASISAGSGTYRFEGNELVMTFEGEDMRLERE